MRRVALLATVLLTLLAVTGCGSDDESPDGSGDATRIELDFQNGETPPVERVDVERGEEVELVITADEPGELHVHSQPEEQMVEYAAGTTTETITLDQPGLVEVERHDIDELVLQLQVN